MDGHFLQKWDAFCKGYYDIHFFCRKYNQIRQTRSYLITDKLLVPFSVMKGHFLQEG